MNDCLPQDAERACLVGRVALGGDPHVVAVRGNMLCDLSALAPTMSDLLDLAAPAEQVRAHDAPPLCTLTEAVRGAAAHDPAIRLLAPCDLQAVKAAGVTFADSMIERVIEERARGDATAALAIRRELADAIGVEIVAIRPGSDAAARAKALLIANGLWSQYLEVGIGPDAEIFTKAQPLSAVGHAAQIGIHPKSSWNNPEPEVVLACSARGVIVGATLGNDVNLRDFEGRSALLLPKAKDNNASCAIGPFVRLFDADFTLDSVRVAELALRIEGADGFVLEGASNMRRISRDPAELVGQIFNAEHQFPDGMMLFLGTLFAPTGDRDVAGEGFTHKLGDRVVITCPQLGALTNIVAHCGDAPPWEFGARALMRSLSRRGLLATN